MEEVEKAQVSPEKEQCKIKTVTISPEKPLATMQAHFPISQATGEVYKIIPIPEMCKMHPTLSVPCEECIRQEEEAKYAKQAKIASALNSINIGPRYRGMEFSDYLPVNEDAKKVLEVCKRYVESFTERLQNCDDVLMLGNMGTGKNMLAACICKGVVERGYTAVHTTASKLLRKIKESWVKDAEKTEQQMIDLFALPDLLVIDEVGLQYGTRTEKMLLFEVINDRYEHKKPTIAISNLNFLAVEQFMGERLIDRFYEGKSAVLEFTWDSYRRRNKAP